MTMELPVLAGIMSTLIFCLSTMPMLSKAFQTKNLASYSLGNIVLSNGGNIVHSVYIFSLPPGPIWLLHLFYLGTTGLMLIWYLRYERKFDLSHVDWALVATLGIPRALSLTHRRVRGART